MQTNQQQQQQVLQMLNMAGQSSSIPGMSGGRGDPGPSSMAQQNANFGQQPGMRPGYPPAGINPRQLAMLQQLSQASQAQGGQGQLSPQQLQLAMASMQASGNQVNQQALMAAMRNMAPGQPQQQPPQGRPPNQQMPQNMPQMAQNMSGADAARAFQQQQIQQLIRQQANPADIARMQQMQANPADIARLQQQMQMNPAELARLQQMQARPSNVGSPGRPMQQQQLAGMPPPMGPGPGQSPRPNVSLNQPMQAQPPALTPQQQQMIAQQQQILMNNPSFQALPQQQQQAQFNQLHARMMFYQAQQAQQAQQAAQQQQQSQQSPVPQGMVQAMSPQQPPMNRQPTPVQQTAHAPTPTPSLPLSSLPQHMAPPRPASASSPRAPSPHHPQGVGTPPPSASVFPQGGPPNAPSPAPSNHSQHSHHQTPRQTPVPPPVPSPLPQQMSTPLQTSTPTPSQQGIPRAPSADPTLGQMQQPQQHPFLPPGQMPQTATAQMPAMPGGVPPQISGQMSAAQFQNLTPQQQQQLSNAMNVLNQTAQNQGTPGQPRPPATMPARPAMPNINTSDFPFDYRLIPQFNNLKSPQWVTQMQQRNPGFLTAVQSANAMVQAGNVRQDVLQRMYGMLSLSVRMQQGQQPGGPQGQQQMQPMAQTATPGPTPPQAGPASAIPPSQQQRIWAGQQAPGASPASPHTPTTARPPPPHLPPPPHTMPQSPSITRRPSSSKKESRDRTPSQSTMPPPTWIPAPGTAPVQVPQRPPPHATPETPTTGGAPSAPHGIPVKEWENALRLDLPITDISLLPTEEIDETQDPSFNGRLPVLSDKDKEQMKEWLEVDKGFVKQLEQNKKNSKAKMMKWAKNVDADTPWWQLRKGETPRMPKARLNIIWPQDKYHQRNRMSHRGRKQIRFSAEQLKAMAEVDDHVIPIRLDLEYDHFRLKDTFMWNCADTVVTPEVFAQSLCEDFHVPPNQFVPKIVAAINERVQEYRDQVLPMIPQLDEENRGKMDPEGDTDSRALCDVFKRARDDGRERDSTDSEEIKTESGHEDDSHIKIVTFDDDVKEKDEVMTVEEAMAKLPTEEEEELRILIKVDIIVGTQCLTDTFEWDIYSKVSPEEFASSYCRELGLSGEFVTALAHDIHEQILVHKRSLFLVGHTIGSGIVQDDEVRTAFLPPVTSVLRKEDVAMSSFTPIFTTFPEEDIAAIERERDREAKRKKRATRARRGIILPDREPHKTHRSLLNNIGPTGGALISVVETVAPAPVTTSRRAAAIAAQANINLLAQDLPIPQPPTPPPVQPTRRGRPPGRPRGTTHVSPTPAAEDGAGANGTPVPSGVKRSFDDDDDNASPAPARKRHHTGRIDSPEQTEAIKIEPQEKQPITNGDAIAVKNANANGKRRLSASEDQLSVPPSRQSQSREPSPSSNDSTTTTAVSPIKDKSFETTPSQSPSNSGSDDDSDSDFEAKPRKPAPKLKLTTRTSATPARNVSSSTINTAGVNASPGSTSTAAAGAGASASKRVPQDAPAWIVKVTNELQSRYPQDNFVVVQRPKPAGEPEGPPEWRMKCLDCPGRIYALGPGESLINFEVHLKNRAHLTNRQARAGKK